MPVGQTIFIKTMARLNLSSESASGQDPVSYLAIDFGTSNCVASAVNAQGDIEFVRFQQDGTLLPTVLFVPRAEFLPDEVDSKEFNSRLRRAKIDERNRYQKDLAELANDLANYDGRNKPHRPIRPKKPKIEDSAGKRKTHAAAVMMYEKELAEYEKALREHSGKLEQFKLKRKEFEQRLIGFISPMSTEDALRKSLLVAMQREGSQAAESKYWDQTFFSAITSGSDCVYGKNALHLYSADPLSGFFLRSPKSFLAMEVRAEYKNIFLEVVKRILGYIKTSAERQFRRKFKGVVLGRPVNYHGVRGDAGNRDALEIMRLACLAIGFESIYFFYEPVAAALSIPAPLISRDLSIVIDIGGGTTDCSIIRGHAVSRSGVGIKVLRSSGTRIGGTDFDEMLAWMQFMPVFGKNAQLRSGLPVPASTLHDAISTRDLPAQIRFRKARHAIEKIRDEVSDKKKIDRLLKLHDLQGQHKVIVEAERIKILATETQRLIARLDFIEENLAIDIDSKEFAFAIQNPIVRVLEQVRAVLDDKQLFPSVAFMTGGMSQSPFLLDALQKEFGPNVKIERLDPMIAVGMGLGHVAKSLGRGGSIDSSLVELGLSS